MRPTRGPGRWLSALKSAVDATHFRPIPELVAQADQRLMDAEGHALETLSALIYEERSRKGLPGFRLSSRIERYWNKAGTKLDLVACHEPSRTLRIASCKRSADSLCRTLSSYDGHIARFMEAMGKRFEGWTVERVGIAPTLLEEHRTKLRAGGYLPQDLRDLTEGL